MPDSGATGHSRTGDSRLDVVIQNDAEHGWVVVHLSGRLDVFTYVELKQKIDPLLEGPAGVSLIFDLGNVSSVTSSGWSVFLATHTRLKRIQGKLGLAGLGPELQRIYLSMKMNELVPAFATLAEARANLTNA